MTRIQAIQRAALVLALGLGAAAEADTNKWTQTGTGLTAEVNVFARPVGQEKTLYAGAQNGFYRSINGGTTWMLDGPPLVDRNVLSLAVDPEDEDRLYAGLNTGLYASADGGATTSAPARRVARHSARSRRRAHRNINRCARQQARHERQRDDDNSGLEHQAAARPRRHTRGCR